MTARQHINLKTKLASALLTLGHVPYEDAKKMSASQICSLYVFDHFPLRVADEGPTEPWNLVPRLIADHREKTAKIDQPQLAKQKRIRARERAHHQTVSGKYLDIVNDTVAAVRVGIRKIPSRPFPKGRKFGG